ncbi:MAG: iron-siderophore ABC transporter substrate-binding protein [Cyanosarcina radialis HA8281-LM2]|jgi:iron complex transport system substrate-binding protein|nr:iron-siderophore ABC transporter substrate-binding protein [Cyanosarcina radialis HA8281-LM2]
MFLRPFIGFLLTAVLTFTLVSACGKNIDSLATISKQPIEKCRKAQHPMGETCIPLHPQRVVTIPPYAFANALALGIKPIATAYDTTEAFPEYLRDRVDGVELLGDMAQPSLEKILRAKPDLILADPWSQDSYKLLSAIAPTVILGRDLSWQEELTELSILLGRKEAGDRLLENYWQRVEKLKQALKGRAPQIQVSIAGVFPGYAYAYGTKSPAGAAINDTGLQRPPLQRGDGYYVLQYVSEESLSDIDGDVLFFLTRGGKNGAKKVLEAIAKRPLWQQLKSVQNGRVYLVGSHWHTGDILAMNRIIDDLFKYLVNTLN